MDELKQQLDSDIYEVRNFMQNGYTVSEFTNQRTGNKKYFMTVYVYLDRIEQPIADTVHVKNATSLEEAFGAREKLTDELKVKVQEEFRRLKEEKQRQLLIPNASQTSAINSKAGQLVI
jgi:hypothetical protein